MNYYRVHSFILLVLLSVLPLIGKVQKHDILVISSYNSGFPTFFDQIEGIKSVFDTTPALLHIECMDTKRFSDPQNIELFYERLKHKKQFGANYQAVILTDDNALVFGLKYQNELFEGLPMVFCGVNNVALALQQNENANMCGVVESVSMQETLELMVRLFPETRNVYAIADRTPAGSADLEKYIGFAGHFPDKQFKFFDLGLLTFGQMCQQLAQIHSNEPVLLLSAYHDSIGKTLDFYQSLDTIRSSLRGPIFHLWKHGIGDGIFGGKIISQYIQAQQAALKIYGALHGAPISKCRVGHESPNVYMFDYNELLHYNIDFGNLPPESVLINEPITFYRQNKAIVQATIAVFLLLVSLVALLIINILKRKKVEQDLRNHRDNLERIVTERTKDLKAALEEWKATTEELNKTNLIIAQKNTELNKALVNLKETQAQLVQAEKMASLGVLTKGVTHEINNPLNFIMGGYLGLKRHLDRGIQLGPEMVNRLLDSIKTGLDRTIFIIHGLIQFSQNTSNGNELCDIKNILENCLQMLRAQTEGRITIALKLDEKCMIKGNPASLHQVFISILQNAVQAINDKGELNIHIRKVGRTMQISISDTGCGISEDNLPHITEPFFTTKAPGQGTGLGLSIAYKIITGYGGKLSFNSKVNEGTTVEITLPLNIE